MRRPGKNLWEVSIPGLLSVLTTHTLTGEVKGLRDFPAGKLPADRHQLLCLPRHGRPRHGSRFPSCSGRSGSGGGEELRVETAPVRNGCCSRLDAGLALEHGGHGDGMDREGGRPPTLDHLWCSAVRGIRQARSPPQTVSASLDRFHRDLPGAPGRVFVMAVPLRRACSLEKGPRNGNQYQKGAFSWT